jgi:hypothetical protein
MPTHTLKKIARRIPTRTSAASSPIAAGDVHRADYTLKRADLEAQFDALGGEERDLSWILMNQALQGEKDGYVVVFKRPIND